ncbi:MAG: hypothetical protein J1E84_02615 [Muribaculaceae bacterium]|nr:hypothetical protein [Muribaculaceae bacterium]
MKKLFLISLAVVGLTMTSCNDTKRQLENAQEENARLSERVATQQELQDSLLTLFNDISDGMAQIKDLEKIISAPTDLSSESNSRKQQIKNDMLAIQQALQERRQRLEQLEKQLANMSGEKQQLIRTIENLKAQIADQQTEIATLTNQLASANIQIEQLGTEVANLNTTVEALNTDLATEQQARQEVEADRARLDAEAHACYYAIGTDKELKARNIIESGFLRKTKIMKGDFDESYFTTADRRTLTKINTHSSKAEVMTGQPKDSYQIVDEGGQQVLKITNPNRFWQTSNFLVIKVK